MRECVTYDQYTGLFTWNYRPIEHFKDGKRHKAASIAKGWNNKYAGEIAGRVASKSADPTYRYIHMTLNGKTYLGHRLVILYIYGRWPYKDVDHMNRDPADNSLDNLREATRSENQQNKKTKLRKSGFRGVQEINGRFAAYIKLHQKTHYLGCFATGEEASQAYISARREMHPFMVS